MKVLVTGANGFIGNHLVRALLGKGYQVRAMVRPTSELRSLEGLNAELVHGDILEQTSLEAAMEGCTWVFHVAGVYSYSQKDASQLVEEAREGMRHVIQAASKMGVKRLVVTSSSVVFGTSSQKQVLDELHPGSLEGEPAYVLAKKAQADMAVELGKNAGLDIVTVHPTVVLGGLDFALTESNHHIVSYLQDPFKTSWIGGCNIVSIQDVVQGHLLAAASGRPGEQYILAGENLEWQAVHRLISELCGMPGPYLKVYHTAAYLASAMQEALSLLTKARPMSTRQQAKMVGNYYWYSHQKAADELGYAPAPARQTLVEAISWLAASEHVLPSVRSQLELSPEIYAYRRGQSISNLNKKH